MMFLQTCHGRFGKLLRQTEPQISPHSAEIGRGHVVALSTTKLEKNNVVIKSTYLLTWNIERPNPKLYVVDMVRSSG